MLHGATLDYIYATTQGYMKLHWITRGYTGLHKATQDCMRLYTEDTLDYIELNRIT